MRPVLVAARSASVPAVRSVRTSVAAIEVRMVRSAAAVRACRAIRLLDASWRGAADRARPEVRWLACDRARDGRADVAARVAGERLARALAERWRIPAWCDALERARATRTQTRLTPEERLANVSGAFRVREGQRQAVRNAHVVLVDDVVTTAATLNACAAALVAGGARIVSYVTFGRAPAVGDR